MLGSRLTLDNIFDLHNMATRPLSTEMRSVSVSDIILLHQNGKDSAHYVDSIGFVELPDTFCSALKSQHQKSSVFPVLFERWKHKVSKTPKLASTHIALRFQ